MPHRPLGAAHLSLDIQLDIGTDIDLGIGIDTDVGVGVDVEVDTTLTFFLPILSPAQATACDTATCRGGELLRLQAGFLFLSGLP